MRTMAATSAGTNTFPPQYKYMPEAETFAEEGKYYEQRATALCSLQALKNSDDFTLISNPPDCAPFDDIILCTTLNNEHVVYLYQIKHQIKAKDLKDAHFTNANAEFNIQKLHEKYIKARVNIEKIIKAQCKYKIIFFTNRPLQNNSKIFVSVEAINLYTTSYGKVYKFHPNFIAAEQDPDKRNFLQLINVYAEQCKIDYTSTCCIKEYLNSRDDVAETIKCDYFGCIKNWCEIKTEKDSLNKEFTSKLLIYTTLKQFGVAIDKYEEVAYQKYQEILKKECLDLFWDLSKNNNLHIKCDHIQYVLGKALEDFQCLNINNNNYEDIISNDHLKTAGKKDQLRYYAGCFSGDLPFIVQNFKLTPTNEYFRYFKIIFIESKTQDDLLTFDKNARNALKQQVVRTKSGQNYNVDQLIQEISCKISVSDLLSLIIDNCNENINKAKEIFVDRRIHKVQLDESIFSVKNRSHMENDVFIITGCLADEFINYFKINSHNVLSLIEDIQRFNNILLNKCEYEYYLEQNQEIIVAEPSYSTQVIDNNKIQIKFDKRFKYVILPNYFNIKTLNSENVHFINIKFSYISKIKIDCITWLRTNGNIKNIKKFRLNKICPLVKIQLSPFEEYGVSKNVYCNCCVEFKEVSNYFKNPFIIISGIPGMGKTYFLKQYSYECATNNFVVLVSLKDHYDYFENSEKSFPEVTAVEHLTYFCNNENPILNEFFIKKLKKHEIIILFDGFDEVAPRFTDIVSEIIKQIKEQNYNIILTTRSVLKEQVENLFSTLAFNLSPFNEEEQETFCEIYYNKMGNSFLNYPAYRNIIRTSINKDKECFTAPLNIQLLSELIFNKVCLGEHLDKHYKFNILEFYENFINYKLEIYTKKYKNSNINKPIIEKYHKFFSIKKLFNKLPKYEAIEDRLNIKLEDYIYQLKTGGEKVGILIGDIDEIFIHRTVAEYFSAKWVFDVFVQNDHFPGEKEFARFIIKMMNQSKSTMNNLFSSDKYNDNKDFSVVKNFFNQMINQSNDLHKAVLENNYGYIKETFNTNIKLVETLNMFNRNLLQTMIVENSSCHSYYSEHIFKVDDFWIQVLKLLIKHSKDILIHKDRSGATVQDYIDERKLSKAPLKIIIYKTLDRYFIYYNRRFQLWEIFRSENLYHCNILELIDVLQITETKFSSIFGAARNGHYSVIHDFYTCGIDIDGVDIEEKHLLHHAAEGGSLAIIDFFKTNGMDENFELLDFYDRALMHYAVISGNLDLIIYLKEHQLDSMTCDKNGLSALHYAIIFNKIDIVKYFLEDSDVNLLSNLSKFSYLQYAAAFCNKDIFKLLLGRGAIMNCKNELIHLIIFTNSCINKSIIEYILLINYDPKIKNKLLNNQKIYNERCFDFIKYLLEEGYGINLKINVLEECLFPKGSLLRYRSMKGQHHYSNKLLGSVLHVAHLENHIEILKLLLKYKIDINVLDNYMSCVLHYALNNYSEKLCETVYFLIKNGANLNYPNASGKTPLDMAVHLKLSDVTKLLIEHVNVNARDAVGDSDMIKILTDKIGDINLSNKDEIIPQYYSAAGDIFNTITNFHTLYVEHVFFEDLSDLKK